MNMPRYKFVVHGVIGEQRGEGAKVAARCLWDSDTDALARDVFVTVSLQCDRSHSLAHRSSFAFSTNFFPQESLFCVLTAYGVYYY